MPHFTEDNLQRIIINPFYAITGAPQLTEEHESAMGEVEWVQANASLMREMGIERWLRQLLDLLEGKIAAPEQPIYPFWAINIDPLFAAEHPPLIEREMWVDIVTAGEVGFAPPGGPFGYGAPGKSEPQRRGKRDGKKDATLRGVGPAAVSVV